MSKKKEKSILQVEVEQELSRASASGDTGTPCAPDLKSFLEDMLRQQAHQHSQLLSAMKDNTESSSQAVLSAVQDVLQVQPTGPVTASELFNPQEDPFVELEDCSSDEEHDFEGWPNPSGKVSSQQTTPLEVPGTSHSASKSTEDFDDGLFQGYNQKPNWDPADEVIVWLKTICDKEVPSNVSKEIFEAFMPPVEIQPLFTPPKLPAAISDRFAMVPKYISRVPKMVNDHLCRAQKELAVAYKPFLEILSFYYSPQYESLKEILPEICPIMDSHKGLLSQGIALIVSAGLKISKARKDALRPIFKTSAVLRGYPTASQVLGTDDLASLSDKASKEQKALYGVFRPTYGTRSKYKGSSSSYSRGNKYSRGYQFPRNL